MPQNKGRYVRTATKDGGESLIETLYGVRYPDGTEQWSDSYSGDEFRTARGQREWLSAREKELSMKHAIIDTDQIVFLKKTKTSLYSKPRTFQAE